MRTAALLAVGTAIFCVAPAVYAQNLKQTNFEDGTGSIGVAPGWHIDNAYKGSVACTGPNGAAVILKLPWVIMRPESSLRGLPAAADQPVAQAGDIVGGLRTVLEKKIGATLKSVRGKRIEDVSPGSPAYLLMYEYVQNGKQMTGLGYFASLDYGSGQPFWQMYSSAVVAPTAQFAKLAPTMLRMWKSWRPNGQPPREGSTSAMWDKIIQQKQESYEKIQEEFRKLL